MSKRFTDTDKWDDPWFDELENEEKLMWLYICDKCSIAGIWKVNFKKLRYHCDSTKTDEQINELFKGRFMEFSPGKWFLPKFLKFHNPQGLNSQKPAILSIRNELIINNLLSIIKQLFGNDYLIIKRNEEELIKNKNKKRSSNFDEIMKANYNDSKYVERPR